MRRSGDRAAVAVGVALALALGAGVARADGPAAAGGANGPPAGGAASGPAGAAAGESPGPAPEPGVIAPPPEVTPASDPLVAPTVPPAPLTRAPLPKRHPWVGPVTIALEAAAVGFAVASIAVISSGPTTDAWRVNLAGGLGAGTIACAAVGVVIGFAIR